MQKLIFRWGGNEISLQDRAPFILSSLDLGQTERTNYTNRRWGTHGFNLTGHFTGARIITAKCTLLGESEEQLFTLRRQAAEVLNPGKDGTLFYNNGFKEYKIAAGVNGTVVFEEFIGNRRGQYFTVKFYCPDPLFRWVEEQVKEFQEITPYLKFPMVIKPRFIFSGLAGGDTKIINPGDAACPLRIEIIGPAKNPVVENLTTGEVIKIEIDLQAGEKITVTTDFGDKKVLLLDNNGKSSNIFHYISPETVFFTLAEGENQVKFYGDTGYDSGKCRIFYSPGYFSV